MLEALKAAGDLVWSDTNHEDLWRRFNDLLWKALELR